MASHFDDLAKAAQAVVSKTLGGAVTFIAYTGGDFAKTEDPERPRFNAVAVLSRGQSEAGIARSTSRAKIRKTEHRLSIDAQVVTTLPWLPDRDDRVIADGKEYSISTSDVSGVGDLVLDLDIVGDA